MFYWLYDALYREGTYLGFLRLFRYITLRSAYGALTALVISIIAGPIVIRRLKMAKIGQQVRSDGPETHLGKHGTPTMGGLLILGSAAVSMLLWGNLSNLFVITALVTAFLLGGLGFYDDWSKIRLSDSKGASPRLKLLVQGVIGLGLGLVLIDIPSWDTTLSIPFFKTLHPDLGWWYVPAAIVFLMATSNSVNLTDGLDGLAVGTVIISVVVYGILAYLAGNARMASYLGIPYISGVGELAVFCSCIAGAGIGFLWFNAHPAQIFMGDTGSLALGGVLGTVALCVKKELIFLLIGGIFVVEAVSVILQVGSFKLRGKRIFRMAPLHHHFEQGGMPESRIIVRFWIVSGLLAVLGLSTIKLQ